MSILAVGGEGGYIAYGMPLVETMGGVDRGTFNNPVGARHSASSAAGRDLAARRHRGQDVRRAGGLAEAADGRLLHANVGTCALFSATSGSSVATAAGGTIALPALGSETIPAARRLARWPSVNLLVCGSLTKCVGGPALHRGHSAGADPSGAVRGLCRACPSGCAAGFRGPEVSPANRRRLLRHLVQPAVIFGIVMALSMANSRRPPKVLPWA